MDNESTHRVWEETQTTEVGKVSCDDSLMKRSFTRRAFGSLSGAKYRWISVVMLIREGGEVMPKRPTVGKAKPGTTFCVVGLREVHSDRKPYQHNSTECSG